MTVLEYEDRLLVVDCGLRFPTAEMVGIDLVLPDFSYLRGRVDDIEGIVITHGHEDHLGALPWILRELAHEGELPPVFGAPLTMAMARSKLDEHRLKEVEVEDVATGEKLELGPFDVELVHMTHSIPDACAVAVTDRPRHGPDHRRLQVRPDARRRTARRRLAARPARRRGAAAAVRRLHQRRPPGLLAQRARHRPAPRADLHGLRGADRGHVLRVEHPPRPAGRQRGVDARSQGRAARALDAQEREHRPLAGPHRGPRGDPGPAARGRRTSRTSGW